MLAEDPEAASTGAVSDGTETSTAAIGVERLRLSEEIILVMRQAGPGLYADRTRGLIVMLWRAGLRISEALALTETDLDARRGAVRTARARSEGRSGWTRGRGR